MMDSPKRKNNKFASFFIDTKKLNEAPVPSDVNQEKKVLLATAKSTTVVIAVLLLLFILVGLPIMFFIAISIHG